MLKASGILLEKKRSRRSRREKALVCDLCYSVCMTIDQLPLSTFGKPKVLRLPSLWGVIINLLALFVPMPIVQNRPLFVLWEYGWGYSMAWTSEDALWTQVPIGWVMIFVSYLVKIL